MPERIAQRPQMLFDQVRRRSGRGPAGTGVCVVNTTSRATRGTAWSKLEPFVLHAAANGFQHGEAAVAFVQVKHAGRDPHRLQRAEAAHAQQQFLADAHAAVAAVQARSQFAVFGRVAVHVGIEQQQIACARPSRARPWRESTPLRVSICTVTGSPVFADGRLHGQLVDVGLQSTLPAASRSRSSRWRKYPWP